MGWYGYGWRPYVPVAARRARAEREMSRLAKKGEKVQPVHIEGRQIARSFWGAAWCRHLESYSDYENRLPRGRTYVRGGAVCHLDIQKGRIEALVSGSEMYEIKGTIKPLPPRKWKEIKARCLGRVGSLLELLQGRFSDEVMGIVTDREHGLFPGPREIDLDCSCPDWADLCKHLAAVLYGVGARLDTQPELLFLLRGVDHQELIAAPADGAVALKSRRKGRRIAADSLAEVFDIDLAPAPAPAQGRRKRKAAPRRSALPSAPAAPPRRPAR